VHTAAEGSAAFVFGRRLVAGIAAEVLGMNPWAEPLFEYFRADFARHNRKKGKDHFAFPRPATSTLPQAFPRKRNIRLSENLHVDDKLFPFRPRR
jgi:hypothetical protein